MQTRTLMVIEDLIQILGSMPRGALECQGGYQARPKIHVKRVFFFYS